MPATLMTLLARTKQGLGDVDQEIFTTSVLEEAVRGALDEYNKAARPRQVIGTVTLATSGREVSISSLTSLISISRVWLPYTAASPEHPPNWRHFEHWFEQQVIYFPDDDEPQSGEVMRLFYLARQTLRYLDGATETTFPPDDETLIYTGCLGYAATSRSVDLIEQVTRDRLTAQQLRAWGLGKLQEFRSGLKTVQRHAALRSSPFVEAAPLDRWDKQREGGGWS